MQTATPLSSRVQWHDLGPSTKLVVVLLVHACLLKCSIAIMAPLCSSFQQHTMLRSVVLRALNTRCDRWRIELVQLAQYVRSSAVSYPAPSKGSPAPSKGSLYKGSRHEFVLPVQEYCEDCPEQSKTVRRDASFKDNAALPAQVALRTGDLIYDGLKNGFRVSNM